MSKKLVADKNFRIETKIQIDGLKYYNATDDRFTINGVYYANGAFCRIPDNLTEINDCVQEVAPCTSGGRVRFITDSPYIAIYVKIRDCTLNHIPNSPLTGTVGLDLYERKNGNQQYLGSFIPPADFSGEYESVLQLGNREKREYVINMPFFSGIYELYIGLDEKAAIDPPTAYAHSTPVVFYGSSITHGGCASRPGNTYPTILSRMLDTDYINLGFAGGARGEDAIANYIAGLKMSCFVYDYDHNAPNCEHLQNTHEKMFQTIRKAQPSLPILILSRPKVHLTPDEKKRLSIIQTTYENAIQAGDKNVYFIPGPELIGEDVIETATVDNVHPNDSGFLSMALAVQKVLKPLL
ncbi:MAG: hypothetical protein J6Q92_05630 [Oscillospiraceae bacterium]|nr:hypothetical protein [Oscillospiraceae bacterium]